MAPFLATLLETDASLLPPAAKELLSKLETKNTEALAKFDKELTESEESMGETEVSDVLRRKAAYLAQIGDKVRAQQCCRHRAARQVLTFTPASCPDALARGADARAREDARARSTDRHQPHHPPRRLLLCRPRARRGIPAEG